MTGSQPFAAVKPLLSQNHNVSTVFSIVKDIEKSFKRVVDDMTRVLDCSANRKKTYVVLHPGLEPETMSFSIPGLE